MATIMNLVCLSGASPIAQFSLFGQQVSTWHYVITVSIYVSPLPVPSAGQAGAFPPLITELELSLKIIFHQLLAHLFCCQCHTDLLWQVPRASFITIGIASQPGSPLYPWPFHMSLFPTSSSTHPLAGFNFLSMSIQACLKTKIVFPWKGLHFPGPNLAQFHHQETLPRVESLEWT